MASILLIVFRRNKTHARRACSQSYRLTVNLPVSLYFVYNNIYINTSSDNIVHHHLKCTRKHSMQ